MTQFDSKSMRDTAQNGHDHYVELCALSTSGTLTDKEWSELRLHLPQCMDCAQSIQEYREVARTGMAMLISERTFKEPPTQKSWSLQIAKRQLFSRLARGESTGWQGDRISPRSNVGNLGARFPKFRPLTFQYAAIIIIIAVLVVTSLFHPRINRGQQSARSTPESSTAEVDQMRDRISALSQEKASLDERLVSMTQKIDQLSSQVHIRTEDLAKWKTLQEQTEDRLGKQDSELSDAHALATSLASERDSIAHKLEDAQSSLVSMQATLDHLREERARQLLRTASLENRLEELSSERTHHEVTREDPRFDSTDSDVRELMGARDLFIADVFDVDQNGRTKKPFGRVFFTKGKSLVIYVFDLDPQRGTASRPFYQAWGRRGVSDPQPVNMGFFNLDSEANKRWILRFDKSEALAQIDAVFVTREPSQGSKKPSGKQLLFASLRTRPNHP